MWRYLPLLWQAGGDLLTEDNKKPAFDSAAGKAALELLQGMAVTDKSVYLDTGNGNYLNLFNSGKIAMLWTGPWDLSSINADIDYGVTLLPGYDGNHETISGPDLYMAFEHSKGRADTAVKFMTWLTSAEVHLRLRDRDRRPAAARVGEQAARLRGVPEEVPRQQGVRREPRQRQARAAEHRVVLRGLHGHRPDGAVGAARPGRAAGGAGHRERPGGERIGGSVTAALLPATARRRTKPSSQKRADQRAAWGMVAPSVLLIGLFGLVPVAWSVVLSFQHSDLQTPATWAGLSNYRELVNDPVFGESIRHTVVYTVLFVPITLVSSLLVAAALNRRLRGISLYRLAVFVPVVTSTVATGVIFSWLLDPDYGVVNGVLHKLGLPQLGFFASPDLALYTMVAMTTWGWIGFGALIFLAGLQSIPQDLLEAAQIDGCSRTKAFWLIQVPLLRPVIGFMLVWLTINALQLFDEVYVTTKGGPLHSTTVVVYYLYQQAFQYFHAGYAAAIACLLFVAIIVITVVQMRLSRDPDLEAEPLMARAFRLRAPSPWHLVLVPLALVMLVPLIWMLITSLSSLEETRRFPPGLPSSLHWESYAQALDRLARSRTGC